MLYLQEKHQTEAGWLVTIVTILVGTEYHKKRTATSGDGGSIPYHIYCRKDKLPVAVIQINCKHLRKSTELAHQFSLRFCDLKCNNRNFKSA